MTKLNDVNTIFSLQSHRIDIYATNILKIYLATGTRGSRDFPPNVAYFHFNLYDSRTTFVQVSHDIRTNVA